jgi:vacuolar-type H+-ATPase subunit E/Vma4
LSDQDWAQRFQEWVYVRRMELEAQEAIMENAFQKVMYEVVNAVFGKK